MTQPNNIPRELQELTHKIASAIREQRSWRADGVLRLEKLHTETSPTPSLPSALGGKRPPTRPPV
jgi:hypothetical protein